MIKYMEEDFTNLNGLNAEQITIEDFNTDNLDNLAINNLQFNLPNGPMGEGDYPELIVSGTVDSLEKGFTPEEWDLISKANQAAKKVGKRLIIRYRLKENEQEVVNKLGNGDKDKAIGEITEKFKQFVPGANLGSVLGKTQNL